MRNNEGKKTFIGFESLEERAPGVLRRCLIGLAPAVGFKLNLRREPFVRALDWRVRRAARDESGGHPG